MRKEVLIGALAAMLASVGFVPCVGGETDVARPAPHPRLLADARDFAELKTKLETTRLGRIGRARLLAEADASLGYGSSERKLDASGRRILSVSRSAVNLIAKCALAYRVTGEAKYAKRAIREAMEVSAFPDWNPSHFLDTAEMAFAVALCYDWLYDVLTPAERDVLSASLREKALTQKVGWWGTTSCNWNQVCNGGLVAAAVATAERNPELSKEVIRRTEAWLPLAMAVFAPDGGFPEGPASYWGYALNYNAIAVAAIEKYAGRPSSLSSIKGFREEAFFMDSCTGPTGLMFNFSDAGANPFARRRGTFASWWLAKRFNLPETLVSWEGKLLEEACRAPIPRTRAEVGNWFFPLTLLYLQEEPSSIPDMPLCRVIDGTNPIATIRTSWTDPEAWFVGVKGGSPSQNHGHMDVGSFVLDALGVRWSYDLGCEPYAKVEKTHAIDLWYMGQRSSRWSLFRYAPEGHSTFQVNGARQAVTKRAEFTERPEVFPARVTLDLSYLYDSMGHSSRSFTLEKDGGLAIEDELDVEANTEIVWRMNTTAEARLEGNRAILSQRDANGRMREMEVTVDNSDIRWQFRSIAEPRGPNDSANPGMNQLFFTYALPAGKGGVRKWRVEFKGIVR